MGDFGICFLKTSLANAKTEERFRGYYRGASKCGNIVVSDNKGAAGGRSAAFVDGSIYNKDELTAEYLSGSDARRTEHLINEMYDRLGHRLFERLDGSFSIMIYDKGNRRILAGIDHINQKNIYLYEDKDLFVLANEIKPILTIIGREKIAWDPQSVLSYIAFHRVLGDGTFFKGIKKLLPGQIIEIDLDEKAVKKTAKRSWPLCFPEISNRKTVNQVAGELKELLANEVLISLREKDSIALALSGGLDSSILAFLMREVLKKEFIGITGGFKELPGQNEIRYGKEIADLLRIDFYEIFPSSEHFWEKLETMTHLMDYPEGGPGLYGLFCISEEASKHNCKVLVHGFGADTLFGGSAWITEAIIRYILGNGAYFKKYFKDINNVNILLKYFRRRGHWVFWDCIKSRSKDMWEACYESTVDRHSLQYLRKEISMKGIKDHFKNILNHDMNNDPFGALVRMIIDHDIPDALHGLERVTKYFGIEATAIYPGKKILEYISAIPLAYRIALYTTKPVIKEIAKDLIPLNMAERGKFAFEHPMGDWIKEDQTNFMKNVIFKGLEEEPFWSILDRKKVTAAYREHCSGEKNHSQLFWQIISIASWFRTFN
jgi:asparagine synthase (glutamine-hydrolysing)